MANRADLSIYQGDDYAATVMVTQNGVPPDQVIAGYTAKAQIRNGCADDNPDIVVEIDTAILSPNVNLSIPGSKTLTLDGDYAWDLQITSPAGGVTTILAGCVHVCPEVTR